MDVTPRRHRILMAAHATGLAVATVTAVATSRASDWQPAWLWPALAAFAIASTALAIQARGVKVSGAFSAIVLTMVLMGPAPAVALGLLSAIVLSIRPRVLERRYVVSNLAVHATFPLAGALLVRALDLHGRSDLAFCLIVLGVYLVTHVLNFALIWGYVVCEGGPDWRRGVRDVFVPVLPVDFAAGVLVVGVAYLSRAAGPGAIGLVAVCVLVSQHMLRIALQAFERGEELEVRNRQLAALQMGLISTTMKTLNLRDHMTARHSAAVARYAREMARELGLPDEEVELIHTAGLFHDIGKFIFPDSILLADTGLTDEQYEIVKRHPAVGADLIAEIEGYGTVAEIVRWHHERIDGRGYPDRIAGDAIPLGSRILAVADVYDVITARDTYRRPVTPAEAFAELRRVAGTQLDADLVDLFIGMVQTRGIAFRHSSDADFEAELMLERRVSEYAAPRLDERPAA